MHVDKSQHSFDKETTAMSIKVDNYKFFKKDYTNPQTEINSHLPFVYFSRFEVDIDGKTTTCVADFERGVIHIHWHAGGRRYLLMDDFDNSEYDIVEFLTHNLEDAPHGTPRLVQSIRTT